MQYTPKMVSIALYPEKLIMAQASGAGIDKCRTVDYSIVMQKLHLRVFITTHRLHVVSVYGPVIFVIRRVTIVTVD